MKIRAINLKQIEWAIRACADKRGIEFIVNSHNAAIERGEMDLVFHLPTGEYRRYAHLMDDLVRIQGQLVAEWDRLYTEALRDDAAMDPRTDDEGNDPREWSGESIERDHAEALEFNAMMDKGLATLCDDGAQYLFDVLDAHSQALLIAACHAEALDMDATRATMAGCKAMGDYLKREELHHEQIRFFAANDEAKRRHLIDIAHDRALGLNLAMDTRAAFYAMTPFNQQCEVERLRREAIWIERERVRHEARRVAEVIRAEFYLGNPVRQREDLELAHDAALAYDAELTEKEEANRLGCIADGGLGLGGYALALPNGCLIEMQKGALTGSVVRFLRRGSYFETERDAKALRDSYRRDAVVIPYGWSFLDTMTRVELIKQQEAKK